MRTKRQIKVDRLFMVFFSTFGFLGAGYFLGTEELVKMFLCFIIAAYGSIRNDSLNNDLEYGRFVKQEDSEWKWIY